MTRSLREFAVYSGALRQVLAAVSYAELNSLADEWAQRLALLAVSKAGGAFVRLDPEYPADRLKFIVEDSAAAVSPRSAGSSRGPTCTTATARRRRSSDAASCR